MRGTKQSRLCTGHCIAPDCFVPRNDDEHDVLIYNQGCGKVCIRGHSKESRMETPAQYGNDAPSAAVDFSVVVPCYNEADSIDEFHQRLTAALAKLDHVFDIIYVNDGSTDTTLDRLIKLHEEDSRSVTVVDLVQNVGQTNAWTAGVKYATGTHIIFIDCDLQVAPEDIGFLLEVFDDSYDMVGAVRVKRKDNYFRILRSRFGNAFIRKILGLPLYDFGSGLKIVNGAFLRSFAPGPFRPINPGSIMLCLRRVAEVPIQHYPRKSGKSRWTLRRFFTLYHNIFRHLVPFIYPFTITPLLLLSVVAFGYLLLAAVSPEDFPYFNRPAVLPMLIALNIVLSFVHLLLLGEFMLRGNGQVQEPAYVIRRIFAANPKVDII